jgi:proliferating cell nuclear antigen
VQINASKEEVRFSANGEIGAGTITLRQNDTKDNETIFDVQENVSLAFALRYLGFFTKASPLSKNVRLCMHKDGTILSPLSPLPSPLSPLPSQPLFLVPLLVEYAIEEDLGHVRYYLAPRIDEDEN